MQWQLLRLERQRVAEITAAVVLRVGVEDFPIGAHVRERQCGALAAAPA